MSDEMILIVARDTYGKLSETQEFLCLQFAHRVLAESQLTVCRHEPYNGACVHCNAPFVNGRAVVMPVRLARRGE